MSQPLLPGILGDASRRSELQREILDLLRAAGPLIDEEIVERLRPRYPQASDSTFRGRRAELVRDGLVRNSGKLGTNGRGNLSILWEIVR